MALGLTFHILAAVIWVGGMFFAYMILRPSAGPLEPAARLQLWQRAFARFFPWVWLSVAALLISGLWLVFRMFGGFAVAPPYVHAMFGLGIVMMLLFAHLYFAPWMRFRRAVTSADWTAAEAGIRQIRIVVGINLVLGLITVVIGGTGPSW